MSKRCKISNRVAPAAPFPDFCTVPPSKRNLMLLSRRFFQICLSAGAKVAEQEDLNATQFSVLTCLSDEPDLDQNALTLRLGIERGHTSALLDELERKGLVERKICEVDRRAKLVRLTPSGLDIHDRLRSKADECHAAISGSLCPADRERLLDMLLHVIEADEVHARGKYVRVAQKIQSKAQGLRPFSS